jgi:hypothetical protein
MIGSRLIDARTRAVERDVIRQLAARDALDERVDRRDEGTWRCGGLA